MLSQMFHQHRWRAVENLSWRHLEPPLIDMQKVSGLSSHWSHPCCSPATAKTLPLKPNTSILLPYMLVLCRFAHLVWVGVPLFSACSAELCCCQNCCVCPAVKIKFFCFHYIQFQWWKMHQSFHHHLDFFSSPTFYSRYV